MSDAGKMIATEIEKVQILIVSYRKKTPYEAGLYNDEKGAVGGTGKIWNNWILDLLWMISYI